MEAGAIASALTSNRGMEITTRQPAANRQIIYGEQRVGGVIVYQSTTGSTHNQFNYIIVIAGHEIDSIVNLYLDGRQVFWDTTQYGNTNRNGVNFGGAAINQTYTGPDGQYYNFGGLVFCSPHFGDDPVGTVDGYLTANDPTWAADGKGNSPYLGGCAYVYLKVEYAPDTFPSQPELKFTVRGKNNIYDPRTGTTGYTHNWALVCADIITDPVFGLGDDSVNETQLIAAANVCDEQIPLAAGGTEAQWGCSYHYDTSVSPGNALAAIMPVAGGRLSRIGGQWYIWPAYWQGASFSFDANSLTGAIKWEPYRSFSTLVNRVTGTYTAANYPYNAAGDLYDSNGFYFGQLQNNFPFGFMTSNFPQYAADVLHGYAADQYLAEDGGQPLPQELDLRATLSVVQAQRAAKVTMLRNRQQGSGSFPMSLSAYRMQPLDVMQFTSPQFGWSEKYLEVTGTALTIGDKTQDGVQSVRALYQVNETAQFVYEWSTTEELTVYDVPAVPQQATRQMLPPTNMTLTSGVSTALIGLDGTLTPRIEVQWNTPEDGFTTQIQIQYALTSAPTNWLTSLLVASDLNSVYITGVVAGTSYNVRIRGLRANGAASPWEEIDGYVVSSTLSVLGILALAESALQAAAYTDGTASIMVSPFTAVIGNASVSCLPAGTYTISDLAQTTFYYVYWIDPNFTGGAITPIATTNSSDFINKPGYFLVGDITTPYAGSGGGSAPTRLAPTTYTDKGTQTTSTPTYAYDGNASSSAIVAGSVTYTPSIDGHPARTQIATGDCLWSGFPSGSSTSQSVYVTCSYQGSTDLTGAVSVLVNGSSVATLLSTNTSNSTATYSYALPTGTAYNTITVEGSVRLSTSAGTSSVSGSLDVYEVYVQ